jgi:cytoskeletal protein CcmA (bactofilin family)
MPDPTPAAEPRRPGPVLAEGTCFSGLVVLHGTARIEGRVEGEVLGADRLRIGERACVEGRVEAGEVVVAGELVGELHGVRRVELCSTARVRAAIHTPRLIVADGSILDGACRTGGGLAEPRQAPPRNAPTP